MKIEAVILAAGKGTRMKSDIPKVLHKINGKPMIDWIIDAIKPVCIDINIVTGFASTVVEEHIEKKYCCDIKFSYQKEQNGTGGAVRAAIANLSGDITHVIICAGDTPLLKTETFKNLKKHFLETGSDLTVVSTALPDAGHYGRIHRDENNELIGIVEYLDADESQLKINEINSGIYLVEKNLLVEAVYKIKNNNNKREYYLTDIIKISKFLNKKVTAFVESDYESLEGVNDIDQLKAAESVMNRRNST
jgi:bifunctional UDP-N-acetylglucosamine pyrophosphorylase / glucosamine-1-phosphate N-acetyltransferase